MYVNHAPGKDYLGETENMLCSEIAAGKETFHYANMSDSSGFPIYLSEKHVLEKTPSRCIQYAVYQLTYSSQPALSIK